MSPRAGINPLQTTEVSKRGRVSGQVALLLRVAERQPDPCLDLLLTPSHQAETGDVSGPLEGGMR